MPAEERSLRNRLAEALYCGNYNHGGWEFAPAGVILAYRQMAERILAALPTVGLVLTSSEDTTQTAEGAR